MTRTRSECKFICDGRDVLMNSGHMKHAIGHALFTPIIDTRAGIYDRSDRVAK
jgi:hypothetical protein